VVAFGDSITDGFFSTINGNDRWPDVLQRRLLRDRDDRPVISVVNQGIAGNMITRAQPTRPARRHPVHGHQRHRRRQRHGASGAARDWFLEHRSSR
jgi:lysophospholipase L1-like esterase